jgi:hypothetical protein
LPLTEYQKSCGFADGIGRVDAPGGRPRPRSPASWGAVPRLGVAGTHGAAAECLGLLAAGSVHRGVGRAAPGPAAAERFWKRLEQIEPSPACDPARIFFRGTSSNGRLGCARAVAGGIGDRLGRRGGGRAAHRHSSRHVLSRQHAGGHRRSPHAGGSGNRVAFFASSNGEVERVADILNEYGVPYQLGLEQFDSPPAYLAERAYMAGANASIYLVKGQVRHGHRFQDSKLVVFGSEDLFETSELIARAPADQVRHGHLFGGPDRSQARGLRSPFGSRRSPIPGVAGDLAGEESGRLHAAGIRRRRQAVRASYAHGSGAALPRRRRGQTGARPHGRRHLDAHQNADQSQNARHGGRALEALRPAQNDRRLPILARQQLAARVRRCL